MGRNVINLTGQRFGRLTVIKRAENKNHRTIWLCKCECGNYSKVDASDLKRGYTKSCGCLLKESTSKRTTTHGKRKTRLYNIWTDMKTRCYNPKDKSFERYGKRGITVCEEWLQNFQAFFDWSIENGYSDNLTLDRINNDKCYSPENCRWVTIKAQQNNRRNNHLITYNGKTQTMKQWSEELNIDYRKLKQRISQMHWTVEKSFTTP